MLVTWQAPVGRSVGTVLLDLWAHSHAHQNMRPLSTSPDKHTGHLNDIQRSGWGNLKVQDLF